MQRYFFFFVLLALTLWEEPDKQFDLLGEHMERLRSMNTALYASEFVVMVERNLGFEAEYHQRHFNGMPHVRFRVDHKAQRYGVLTTLEIKHAMCTMLNTMLRERRVHLWEEFVSRDPRGMKRRLREQLEIYSYQFKGAVSVFNKDQLALSGKVGGMKDDVCIALQLACYYSSNPEFYV